MPSVGFWPKVLINCDLHAPLLERAEALGVSSWDRLPFVGRYPPRDRTECLRGWSRKMKPTAPRRDFRSPPVRRF